MKGIWVIGLLLFSLTFVVAADCPYGETDCAYPGECGRYVDTDGDKLCDHSQELVDKEVTQEKFIEQKSGEILTGPEVLEVSSSAKVGGGKTYYFLEIALITLALYLISNYLKRSKIIRVITHKRIWNGVLLISFLVSAGLGILLVLRIQYGWTLFTFNQLFWHVELGIIMAVVSITHTLEHIPFWKGYFR